MKTDTDTPTVLVFRRRLLAWSETFVAHQAHALPTWRAVFAGIGRSDAGFDLMGGSTTLLQDECADRPTLARWKLSLTGHPDRRWLDAVRAERPLLVHAHFVSSGVRAQSLARALDVPLIVTCHGYDVLARMKSRRAERRRAALLRSADRVIAVSDFLAARVRDLGVPADRVTRHYIGTALPEKAWDGHPPAPAMLFVGRLIHGKGCVDALDAFAKVRALLPRATFDIVGDGPLRAELEARARSIGGVRFLGVLTPAGVAQAYRSARVLCNPSRISPTGWQEAFGLVFIEAQAAGVPAVAYANGGVGEAIADGHTGYTVASGDVDALVARLHAVLSDDDLHRRLALGARQRVERCFDLSAQALTLEAIYRETLGARSTRSGAA